MRVEQDTDIRLICSVILAIVFSAYLSAGHADTERAADISKVNGSISLSEQSAGKVSTVNGGISLGDGVQAREVSTVNGSIHLGNDVLVYSARSVNGTIRGGRRLNVSTSLQTVNGAIRLSQETQIGYDVSTVNGAIELHNTRLGRDIHTVNGNVLVLSGSVVEGDIIIKENRRRTSLFWMRRSTIKKPRLEIGAGSAVKGTIHLHREVDLRIHPTASVGRVVEHF